MKCVSAKTPAFVNNGNPKSCKKRIRNKTIGVRAGGGGAGGLQPPPPKVWATQFFWAAREIWAKPVFKEVSMLFFSKR